MKKRIWIKVEKLQLSELRKTRIPGLKNNEKYTSGDLEIGFQGFTIGPILITLRGENDLSQNYAQSNARFLDVPSKHRLKNNGRPPRRRMLEDVIALAVADEYLRRRKGELLPIFNNNEYGFSFPWFSPPEWRGSLRIPVDFIRIFNFECREDGPAYAHVQIGHHLVFWNMCVYDRRRRNPFKFENKNIRNRKILQAINQLLAKKKVRDYIKRLILSHHAISDGTEFIDRIPGCQTDSLPPRIRFY